MIGPEPTRVFVVAPTPTTRAGLRAVLGEAGQTLAVVGEADALPLPDSPEGIEASGADVVVVLADGEDFLAEEEPGLAPSVVPAGGGLLLLTDEERSVAVLRGLAGEEGGWGVVAPDAPPGELAAAVEAVARGLVVLPREMAGRVIGDAPPADLDEVEDPLTAREHEILGLLSEGLPNKRIARQLGISEHTVKFHVSSVFAKLGAQSRAEAVSIGARQGLLVL